MTELLIKEIKDPNGLMNKTHKCPKCGSPFFRTIDTKNMIRKCKGHLISRGIYTGCGFTWKSEDDHLYYTV